MKNCIILHGCPSDEEEAMDSEKRTYDKHWIPWLKEELSKKDYIVNTPLMPEPWTPNYEKFRGEFEKLDVNDNTILVGHSCGCAFLVRWLGETKKKVDKLILVAPWKIPGRADGVDQDFYTFKIDSSIQNRVNEIIMFTSNDEEEDGKKSLALYSSEIGGGIIELKDHGHYTSGDMGAEEFPELLSVILKEDL